MVAESTSSVPVPPMPHEQNLCRTLLRAHTGERRDARWYLADVEHTADCRPSAAGAEVHQLSALSHGRHHAACPPRGRPVCRTASIPRGATGASACQGGHHHASASLHNPIPAMCHSTPTPRWAALEARACDRPSTATPCPPAPGKRQNVQARPGGCQRSSVDHSRPAPGWPADAPAAASLREPAVLPGAWASLAQGPCARRGLPTHA
jgi:hypothetical protein